jgi:outer membrane protein assembly factor BamB
MRCLPLVLLLLSLSACSWFGDDDEIDLSAPAELVEFKQTLNVKKAWQVNIGAGNSKQGINLVPAIEGDTIFAVDYKGRVLSVDALSGRTKWRTETELDVSSGPSVKENMLLIGTLDGTVHAFRAADGSPMWQAAVSSEVLALPVLEDGVVVVRCLDGRVFGLDADNGSRLWVYDRSVPLLSLRGNGTPLGRAGIVYVGYDGGYVVALRAADGRVVWEQPVVAAEGRTELERLVDIDGRMAVVATDLYVSSFKGRVASLAVESGRLLWFKDIGSATGVVVNRTRLAVSDRDGNLWLLDRRNGSTLWKQDILLRRGLTTPAIYDRYAVVGDFEGYLHWFDAEDGTLVARTKVSKKGFASAPFSVGTTLYVLTNNGDLTAYRAGAAI